MTAFNFTPVAATQTLAVSGTSGSTGLSVTGRSLSLRRPHLSPLVGDRPLDQPMRPLPTHDT